MLLLQTPAPTVVQDPLTAKKARVEDCGSAKQCLDVQLPGGAAITAPDGGLTLPVYGTVSAQLADGGVLASETTAAAAALDTRDVRKLLELILAEQQAQTQALLNLKDPGRYTP